MSDQHQTAAKRIERPTPAIRPAIVLLLACLGSAGPATVLGSSPCVDAPLSPGEAQVHWRWISLLEAGVEACLPLSSSLSPSWTARKLFSADARSTWPELQPFCVYEHDGAGPIDADDLGYLDALDGSIEQFPPRPSTTIPKLAVASVPDLAAIGPAGVLTDSLRPVLAQTFDRYAGIMQLLVVPGGPPRVRLALLDTSPTGGGTVEWSAHGHGLRLLAERLLCATGACLATIDSRLALAYRTIDAGQRTSRFDATGGSIGLLGELAEATVDALHAWHTQAGPDDRLVLNLSLAWDALYGGADPSQTPDEMPPPVAAVYRALEAVACDVRAVAVAAAGNRPDRHASGVATAPLPAAWGRRTVSCGGPPRPLVLAAGAVDARHRPLPNAIAGDLPEWVAYGDHATRVALDAFGAPAPVLTGSSVSALVLSSSLAAVAAYRQDLSMPAVADLVSAGGLDLNVEATLCPPQGTSCPNRRSISVCSSVAEACQGSPSHCPSLPPTCPSRAASFPIAGTLPSFPLLDVATWTTASDPCAIAGVCGSTEIRWQPLQAAPVSACPARQHHGLGRRPGVRPQPQSAMCPTCSYRQTDGGFFGEIDPSAPQLQSPTLELRCAGSTVSYTLAPQIDSLSAGQTLRVSSLPTGCSKATLHFTVDAQSGPPIAMSEPVFIVQ